MLDNLVMEVAYDPNGIPRELIDWCVANIGPISEEHNVSGFSFVMGSGWWISCPRRVENGKVRIKARFKDASAQILFKLTFHGFQ